MVSRRFDIGFPAAAAADLEDTGGREGADMAVILLLLVSNVGIAAGS